jgi:preprotein translocase subunit SecA
VAELPAPELLEDVRQVYRADLLEISQRDFEHIERELNSGELRRRGNYTVITDAIAELEWWACFKHPRRVPSNPKPGSQPTAAAGATQPPPKVHKKPWRNAPCPCGSGKKYKHCCGKGTTQAAGIPKPLA